MTNGKKEERHANLIPRRIWRVSMAWFILVLSLAVTIWAWRSNVGQARERERISFEQEMDRSRASIQARLQVYEDALYGTRSIFEANKAVTREMFHDYVAGLDIEKRYPGVQGIGYALSIPFSQKTAHINQIHREGFPSYTIRPEGDRPQYTPIIYIEPFDWRNQRAFGFDMFSEPVRRAALEYARDNGQTSVSGKVKLLQENGADEQAGFLMYLPVYRQGTPAGTVTERRAALLGYVYSPFRVNNLMQGAIREQFPLSTFEIYSGRATNSESLMYRDPVFSKLAREYQPALIRTAELKFGGQVWTLRFVSLPALDALVRERQNPVILPAGILIGLLLFGLANLLMRMESRALGMAEIMTARFRESEERYRSLFELNPHPVWAYDRSTLQFLAVNAAAIHDYGYSREEFLSMTLKDIRPAEDVPALLKRLSIHHNDRRSVSIWRHLRKSGECMDVEISSHSLVLDGRRAELVIAVDITERRRAEEALRQSEERLRLLIDGVKDYAIYMLDCEGRITSWNAGAERIKGYSAEEITGQHFSQFYTQEDIESGQPGQLLEKALREGRAEDEGWRVRKDGSRFWADGAVAALVDPAGRPIGFAKITRDLTERKETEERMRNLNTELEHRNLELTAVNNELESFSYSVSHDLRAPLRAIDGFSGALLEDCRETLNPLGMEYLQRVRAATARMGQLIDDLLKLARTARCKMLRQTVDLSAVAQEIASELQKTEPQRRVRFTIAPGLVVKGDRGLLRIMLENLLGNAWKFTSRTPEARIEFGVHRQGKQRTCFISDNGAGFDMKYADKLFGAFQRLHDITEFPGTGIGLATVQRIIHRHGGQIWASSEVDKGATFSFVLASTDDVAIPRNAFDDAAASSESSYSPSVAEVET
ncbi:MAG TPA: CHASE domain-containing protein [Candidatus Angelobacter sp.]|nr:CHASE domain-containing protein [Candidatus Angelobacter sp.]